MYALVQIIAMLANTLSTIVIIWFIISMLFAFNVVSRDNQFLWEVNMAIERLLSPILNPIRRILPNTGAIDFSPLVLILILNAVIYILQDIAY